MRARYFVIAGAAAVILIISVGLGVKLRHAVAPPPAATATVAEGLSTRPIVSFTLNDPAGRVVTEADFRGRWTLVFFGFTHCPDICPLSMLYASDLLKSLGLLAESLHVVFITVDPTRDTPDVVLDYLTNFDSRIVGLRGTGHQTADAVRAFGAYYAIRPAFGADGEDYNVEHSNAFYLLDPAGRLQRAFVLKKADDLTREIRSTIFTTPKE